MTIASASEIAERYARVCDEVGPGVTVVVATKYVSAEEMGALAEAGVAVVGENRAQDLEHKHAAYGDAFRWHFIGHLQSNKVKVVNQLCELVHSVGSDSAARRVTVPALLEVNLTGEESKSGVAPEEIGAYVERYPVIRGLMTMPPLDRRSRGVTAALSTPPRARRRARTDRPEHGNVAGLPRRGRRGRDHRQGRSDDLRRRPELDSRGHGVQRSVESYARLLRHRRGRGMGRRPPRDERAAARREQSSA